MPDSPDAAPNPAALIRRPPAITMRAILSLAWPVIATNFLMTAVQWVDLYMVGRLGKGPVAAVGLAGFVMSLFWLVLMAVQTGTATVVAQAHGASDQERVDGTTKQALILGGLLAVVVTTIACWPGSPLLYNLFLALDAAPDVARDGETYLRIICYGLPAQLILLVGQAALRSCGDTRTPLWLTGFSNIVNIVLNYILIFGHFGFPAMGVAGAAWGTTIARTWEAVSYLALMSTTLSRARLRWRSWAIDRAIMGSLLRIGLPAAGEQLLISIGFLFYNKLIASYGTAELAAYQIGVIMLQVSFMPGFGFSVAATTLVGQWIGAGNRDQAERAGTWCTQLACLFMPLLGVVFVFMADPFARAFLDDATVVPLATTFIRLLAISQPTMAIHFTLSGALRGAADTRSPLWAAIVSMYLVRLPFSALTVYGFGWSVYWVWMGMVFAHLARALFLYGRWKQGTWRTIEV